jgi:hypothetical protein
MPITDCKLYRRSRRTFCEGAWVGRTSMPDNLNLNLNLDQNLNLNLGAALGSGVGPRYNTEDFCRLSPLPPPDPANLPTLYAPYWDPEHRAWWYVHEFITDIPWFLGNEPIWSIWLELILQNHIVVPNTDLGGGVVIVANVPLDTVRLGRQLLGVLHASNERADRGAEIVDQASALGALSYWAGMLRIDPAKEPNTYLLIRVARKIGEFVAMGLKELFRMRRPAQIYPWIMPLIDGPDTPSFPSSHALQAHLISDVLKLALGNRGQLWGPPPPAAVAWPLGAPPAWPPPLSVNPTAIALDHLAERVAFNREVAGVHYRMDSAAGRYVARYCAVQLFNLPAGSLFQDLVAAATAELVNLP